MNEIWKDVIGYEGKYQVSNLGDVKSLSRKICNHLGCYISKEKIIKKNNDKYGYYIIDLCLNGNKKQFKVHQLVAMAFLGHTTCGHKLVVDHINDNPKDNRVENLQIVTQRENAFKTQGNYSSKYKGVCWDKQMKKWRSIIYINGKKLFLGLFNIEEEAHQAYQNKLLTLNN